MSGRIRRRRFLALAAAGLTLPGARGQEADGLPQRDTSDPGEARILALFSFDKGTYYFNPAGLHVQVGETVEWALGQRTVAAYHPENENHELRIPESARPFDSSRGGVVDGVFRWTFQQEGTYDCYCAAQEYLGMVGRIVVGQPGGPASRAPGYGNREGRMVMYSDAARMLNYLDPQRIVAEKAIPYPTDLLRKRFPWR